MSKINTKIELHLPCKRSRIGPVTIGLPTHKADAWCTRGRVLVHARSPPPPPPELPFHSRINRAADLYQKNIVEKCSGSDGQHAIRLTQMSPSQKRTEIRPMDWSKACLYMNHLEITLLFNYSRPHNLPYIAAGSCERAHAFKCLAPLAPINKITKLTHTHTHAQRAWLIESQTLTNDTALETWTASSYIGQT